MLRDPLLPAGWHPAQWDPDYVTLRDTWLTGPQSGKGRTVIGDIEGDGLLREQGTPGSPSFKPAGTELWCVGAMDVDTGEKFYWGYEQGGDWVKECLDFLREADCTLFHHGIGFDYPYLEEHCAAWGYPGWERPERAWDTEVVAKVIWPYDSLIEPDLKRIRRGQMPGQMLKRMSVAAWGYRLGGTQKMDYTGPFEKAGVKSLAFQEWCPRMATYLMSGDLEVPFNLWKRAKVKMGWEVGEGQSVPVTPRWSEETLLDEHAVARIVFEQEEDGVRFDLEKAKRLAVELQNKQAELEDALVQTFGSWWQPLQAADVGTSPAVDRNVKLVGEADITVPRVSEKTGKELKPYVGPPLCEYREGQPYVDVVWTQFNPGSRDHLAQRLQAVFGWKPKKFGANGKPTVDESVLEEIPEAVIPAETRKIIQDYFVVAKTLGTLSKGKKSWIGLCDPVTSRIYGQMDPTGAVTRRGTHRNPNLSGTPSVKKEKVTLPDGTKTEQVVYGLEGRYGWECRELFVSDEGWEQTGVDASSLELIDLGHYLAPLDGGAFAARVCDPSRDAHTEHAEICGTTRADAKTTIYLFVYGGSAYKLSLDKGIVVGWEEVPALLNYRGLPMLLRSLEKRFDEDFVAKLDDMQKARIAKCRVIIMKLEAGIEGLKQLKEGVSEAAKRGWLKAMDGSRIVVRKAHAALNSLLQSAGAISCKRWLRYIHEELRKLGLRRGRDFKQVLWVHDEVQITHRPGLGPVIRQVAEDCMVRVGESLGLRGRYRTDGKTGANWAETH